MAIGSIAQSSSGLQPAVVLEHVTKLFGQFAAVRNVSGSFPAGKLYAILGENGAGKSTLMRVIAGLARPSRGTVRIFGLPNLNEWAARIGYMAHAPLLYDELTGPENLRYFGALYSSAAAGEANVQSAMHMVGLDPKLNRRTSAYSQGMRQRLALARALIHNPELLLLDEPFSNVDIASTRAMADLLTKLRDGSRTIFVITHQTQIIASIADETVTLHNGQIIERKAHAGQSSVYEAIR